MANKLEIERKFVVKFPKSWGNIAELFSNIVEIQNIEQTYLNPERGNPSARVRKTTNGMTGGKDITYEYNQKFQVKPGVHKEKEKSISKAEYNKFMKNAHKDKITLSKMRFVFNYENQIFELDVFKAPLKGLAILEIELKSLKQKVKLPPFLDLIKEITEESQLNNFALASKSLYK